MRPQILGALLDAVAVALHRLPSIKLPGLPRMADFALWATAAETAFGWASGAFMTAYQGNRESANEVALEASVVARPLLDLLEAEGEWIGSSGELLKVLEERQGDHVRKVAGWPKNPQSLSGHLKRLAPNLRAGGWQVTFHREARQRLVIIERVKACASPPTLASFPDDDSPMQSNAKHGNLFPNDERDGHDAGAGVGDPAWESNAVGWEEGEL